ncbi:GreA/GreB family elongation factor [Mycoplasma struthionis]|uniref:GreA/GreB family elongation factor n=1 Tax=Mycoplasma struthionis TaxID=538220 RepID=UPI0038CC1DDB
MENEILEIQHILENAEIIDETSKNSNIVKIGSSVNVFNLSDNKKYNVTIVGALDADPFNDKISNSSPLARAILGREVGEILEVEAPKKYRVKIESIN